MKTTVEQVEELAEDLSCLDFSQGAAVRVANLIMSLRDRITDLEEALQQGTKDQ